MKKDYVHASLLALGIVFLVGVSLAISQPRKQIDVSSARNDTQAFAQPLPTLSTKQKTSFVIGRSLFHGVSNDNRTPTQRGIRPSYNALTCGSCHVSDGRGNPETTPSVLVKLFNPSTKDNQDPIYGAQIRDQGTDPDATIIHSGTSVVLKNFSRGPLDARTKTYQRIAPIVAGSGLIEAIDERWITSHADPQDTDHDGISGRISYVNNPYTGKKTIGRFGWKATQASVATQSLLAAHEDLGMTNSLFPAPGCARFIPCENNTLGGDDEKNLILYARSLAPVSQRKTTSNSGRQTFASLGCASCHMDNAPISANDIVSAPTTIHPFSDFLLHNMGSALADPGRISGHDADEFRTAPLWGLGLMEKVNGRLALMHDGRAKSFDEAIRFHGGEAQNSTRSYLRLTDSQKHEVIEYLESL